MNIPSMHRRLFFVAPALLFLAACNVDVGPADIQVMRESRPLGDAKELAVNVKYSVGHLEISRAADDKLFSMDLQYDRNVNDPNFSFDGTDRASMRLDMNSHKVSMGNHGRDNDLTLRLTDKVPIDLDLESGVAESRLEMTNLKVRRMRLRGGVGKTEVTFDKPSGQKMSSLDVESGVGELIIHGLGNAQVERVELKGGVGHTELDFTGDVNEANIDAKVEVGVGAVRITLPRDADVEVEAEGSFLSNISAPSFEKSGHTYTHRGGGSGKIRIHVQSGIGGVEVELI
jgi:N-terminal domain of toast_rack, DUF2154